MRAGKLYSRGAIRMTLANFTNLRRLVDLSLQRFQERMQAKAVEATKQQAEQTIRQTSSEIGHA